MEAHPEVALNCDLAVEVGGEPDGLVQSVGLTPGWGGEDFEFGHVGVVVDDDDRALVVLVGVVHVEDRVVRGHDDAEGLIVFDVVVGTPDGLDHAVVPGVRVGLVLVDVDQALVVVGLGGSVPGAPPGGEGFVLVCVGAGDAVVVDEGEPAFADLGVPALEIEFISHSVMGGDGIWGGCWNEGDEDQRCCERQQNDRQPESGG